MHKSFIKDFHQSYSFSSEEKPAEVWALSVTGNRKPEAVHGIPHEVLNKVSNLSRFWTGWGFTEDKAWLLFKDKEDAIFTKIHVGEDQ
jgi:hypothetical protein